MKTLTYLIIVCILFSCGESSKNTKHTSIGADTLKGVKIGLPKTIADLGQKVFLSTCATCHKDTINSVGPAPELLAGLSPRYVLAALTFGRMKIQAEKLSDDERNAVAQWITKTELKDNSIPKEIFTAFSLEPHYDIKYDYSGWGGNLEGTGFRTEAQAGITNANVGSLQLKWAFAFPDATQVRCKPAFVGDWLIEGSQFGEVYAINIHTGKPAWKFNASAGIRGAVTVTQKEGKATAFFADYSTNVYSIDVTTGKLLWQTRSGFHPQSSVTGSVAVSENKIFVPISSFEVGSAKNPAYDCCTSSGGVVSLDALSGQILWTYKVISETPKVSGKKKNGKSFYGPAGAIVWCSPTVDVKRGLLYIGTGENYTIPATNTSDAIQAIDIKTGKLVWNFQGTPQDTWNRACPGNPNCPDKEGPDFDFGMAPLLVHQSNGKDILVAGQKSGVVHALTPEGKLLWQKRIGKGGRLGGIHWGMATDGNTVYAANADNTYAIDKRDSTLKPTPGIYALDLKTGKVVWSTPSPACDPNVKGCFQSNSAAPTVSSDIVFAGGLDGHIRGYSAKDGKIVWDFNTVREYETINAVKGNGGALDGAAPVVANGMLFVNSGYDRFGEIPGNVLLAFELKK